MSKTITIKKDIPTAPERVFAAWITPDALTQWYSPGNGWTIPYAEVDATVGGAFKIGFQSPDGKNDFDFEGTYTELTKPKRIAYTIGDGRPVEITLDDKKGVTKLTVTFAMEDSNSEEQQRSGWSAQVDNLAAFLLKSKTYDKGSYGG